MNKKAISTIEGRLEHIVYHNTDNHYTIAKLSIPGSKSRINFLELLRASHCDYHLDCNALKYMETKKFPRSKTNQLISHKGKWFKDEKRWKAFLKSQGVTKKLYVIVRNQTKSVKKR